MTGRVRPDVLVLDASAAVNALLNDGAARRAAALTPLHAPHLTDSEVTSVLRRHTAAGRITAGQGRAALDTWTRLGVRRHATTALLGRVWDLRTNLSAYDATYVALAEALECTLATSDARLARAPGVRCPVTVLPD